ncbi:uncharacterized protein AMSG_08981 [Thecamonas trahens ATCC 50062]|uniref:C2 domain-containing protein n=1 Tax=Thecamonas trahens ATCC 50062 TaxID=461836 RepID=A0A0L0DN47_THETB|nr:hypothetical protein AMSG_08981 [Thecamonas trahens ATCC 50062]KNC52838.1 hypothetical protein AMSG_08981 [Thecamonas trahens ATCC 50062]|eukprot:XP_013754943.1 hypothetical protein AMSG_08981 [Thecamonas trahens ATCC 50062]
MSYSDSYDDRSPAEHLLVRVIKGVDLAARDSSGKSDPYVVIKYGKEKAKTAYKEQTLEPHWEETHQFPYDKSATAIELEVWDWDKIGADFMGRCSVPIEDIPFGRPEALWYELRDKKGRVTKKAHGKILVELGFILPEADGIPIRTGLGDDYAAYGSHPAYAPRPAGPHGYPPHYAHPSSRRPPARRDPNLDRYGRPRDPLDSEAGYHQAFEREYRAMVNRVVRDAHGLRSAGGEALPSHAHLPSHAAPPQPAGYGAGYGHSYGSGAYGPGAYASGYPPASAGGYYPPPAADIVPPYSRYGDIL